MIFIELGKQRDIALAELISYIDAKANVSISLLGQVGLLSQEPLGLQKLGGMVKYGTIVNTVETSAVHDLVREILPVLSEIQGSKIFFGISVYPGDKPSISKNILRDRKKLGLTLKKELAAQGRSVRFIESKDDVLSSVAVRTNKLLTRGKEVVLIPDGNQLHIGVTQWTQDFSNWSDRDYGRPARDAKSGMLPPKLARMLVNLAHPTASETLLDPFCGSGTVLMEAGLLGVSSLIGTDVEKKAVEDTKKNLAWVKATVDPAFPDAQIFQSSAETLTSHIQPASIDCIVAEGYLGKPKFSALPDSALAAEISELEHLYRNSFQELFKLLALNGRAVMAFPIFKNSAGWKALFLRGMLEEIGFTLVDPFPLPIKGFEKRLSPNGGLHYSREDQFTGREILLLKK